MTNIVFIATSIDGYISDKDGNLDWLQAIPNPDNIDCGYLSLIKKIDAIIMGRNTFESVDGLDCEWPYTKPVFVLSNKLTKLAAEYEGKASIISGPLKSILQDLNNSGYKNLYIDGGVTIQNFLKEDLIDEMIITTIPILLGGGDRLFGELVTPVMFELQESKVFLQEIVQNSYRKIYSS